MQPEITSPYKHDSRDEHAQELRGIPKAKQVEITAIASLFSGPIPPPEVFRQYHDIDPKISDHILNAAQKEQQHRHSQADSQRQIDLEIIKEEAKTTQRAQIAMTTIVVVTILTSFGLLYLRPEYPLIGATGVIGGLLLPVINSAMSSMFGRRQAPQETQSNTSIDSDKSAQSNKSQKKKSRKR